MYVLKPLTLAILLFTLSSCIDVNKDQKNPKADPIVSKQFFENSYRGAILRDENMGKGIVEVDSGCTGFFLKNKDNKNYILSARHCFDYDAVKWCKNSGSAEVYDSSYKDITCVKVAVGDKFHDTVILEFENYERDRSQDFSLGSFYLEDSTMLQMLGFPADKYNRANFLQLTQHCWAKPNESFVDFWWYFWTSIFDYFYYGSDVSEDHYFFHNCSTYGGNSGGPMFVEGTRIAVGLPNKYLPDNYYQYSSIRTSEGIRLADFVEDFAKEIKDLGIAVTEKIPELLRVPQTHLTEGTFFSQKYFCDLKVRNVVYNTTTYPHRFSTYFSGEGEDCDGISHNFSCDEKGFCQDEDKITAIHLRKDKITFYYFKTEDPENKALFKKFVKN